MEYDIVIIGGGVAGLTAGIYSARSNRKVLIVENNYIGGTCTSLECIKNYPGFSEISGIDLVQKMYTQCIELGVNFEFGDIKHIDFDKNMVVFEEKKIDYKSLIIASGTSPKKLNAKGEEHFLHKGLSYCAICDGALFKNKNVVLVTDNYSGSKAYHYLKKITENLTILNLYDAFEKTSIPQYNNITNMEIIGEKQVSAIKFDCDGISKVINCDGVFIELGKVSNLSLYSDKLKSENGFIISDENCHTNIPNVFVAGDVRKKSLRQIITACADGAVASCEAIKYISD